MAWYTVGDKISQPLQSAEKPSDFKFRLDETLLTPRVGSCRKFSFQQHSSDTSCMLQIQLKGDESKAKHKYTIYAHIWYIYGI